MSFQIGLKKNLNPYSNSKSHQRELSILKLLITLTSKQMRLTGLKMEKFKMLKTKDHADHAGLSQQLELLNPHWLLLQANFQIYPSNNLLIALRMATTDAMEVGWIMLSNIYILINSALINSIHTQEEMDHAPSLAVQMVKF